MESHEAGKAGRADFHVRPEFVEKWAEVELLPPGRGSWKASTPLLARIGTLNQLAVVGQDSVEP